MKGCLKTLAKQIRIDPINVKIDKRLPPCMEGPCELTCQLQVEFIKPYYLLTIKTEGTLTLSCQRCLSHFEYNYKNKTQLVVCENEDMAKKYQDMNECIVAEGFQIDLAEILTDELSLYLPEKHPDIADCDPEINIWMMQSS